ncbi:MAG: permease-like cell division protein FtsX [Desulfuromonadales bacterium]|nr:permease-like cell division protein FtsX [Desulfuromonadales bacterium]
MALRPGYFLHCALRNMRQSPVLSLAAVVTVTLALSLLALFAIAVLNVQQLLLVWGDESAVVAYFAVEPTAKQQQELLAGIGARPGVAGVDYVSSTAARERFRERLGVDADLLDGLDPDLLPASLEIRLQPDGTAALHLDNLVETLRKDARFDDVRHGREWLAKLEAFLQLLRAIGAGLGGFLAFAAVIIVANTIKLTLYARQDELEAMTLVGATSLFIKLPYLVEGAVQGLLGGLLALLASFLAFHIGLRDSLGELLLVTGVDSIAYLPPAWQVGMVAAGGAIGLLGSLFALRKFVRFGPA